MKTRQRSVEQLGWVRARQWRFAHFVPSPPPEFPKQLLRTWCGIQLTVEQVGVPGGLPRCAHCVRSGS